MASLIGWPTFFPGRRERTHDVAPPTPPEAVAPSGPVGAREARDAVVVASLIKRPITLTKAETLIDQLVPYRTKFLLRADASPLHNLVGQEPPRLNDTTLRYIAPVLVDKVLPGARDYLLDRLVRNLPAEPTATGEQAMPGAVDVAEAMRRIVGKLGGAGRSVLAHTADACEREARTLTDRLIRDTSPLGPESIHTLARNLLRVEVLTLVLEALGSTAGLEEARFQSRRLARAALRRAGEALEAFVADRGLKALHSSLSVLAAVDGLIVIVLRILDAHRERQQDDGPFVESADRLDVARYVQAMGRLADALLQMSGRAAVTPKLDELFFAALIRQIGWMHRFLAHLGHEDKPKEMDALQKRLEARIAQLAGFAGEALVRSTMRRTTPVADVDALLRRTEAIAKLIAVMDRPAELEALTLRITVVREALAAAAAMPAAPPDPEDFAPRALPA